MENPAQRNLASPWERLVSYGVDFSLGLMINLLVVGMLATSGTIDIFINSFLNTLLFLLIINSLFFPLLNIILISLVGGTVGKFLSGQRIVKASGLKLTFGEAFLRDYLGGIVAKLLFYLGYIWIFIDKNHQGWHDMIVDSYVLRKGKLMVLTGAAVFLALTILNIKLILDIKAAFLKNSNLYIRTGQDIVSEFKNFYQSTSKDLK